MKTTIFLDRDGVLLKPVRTDNNKERAAWTLREYALVESAFATLNRLDQTGIFQFFVITNQPDISSGFLSYENLNKIHEKLLQDFPMIQEVYFCPHNQFNNCTCRKPKISLLKDISKKYRVEFTNSWLVGDRWIDIQAGKIVGSKTILIETEFSWKSSGGIKPPKYLVPDYVIKSIKEVENILLDRKS